MNIKARNFLERANDVKLEILKNEDGSYELGFLPIESRLSLFEDRSKIILTQLNIDDIGNLKKAFNDLFSKVEDEYYIENPKDI